MSFQIKDLRSIVASMVNHARATQQQVDDFTVGSAARTMLEAPAIEINELYLQMLNGLKDAIPAAIYPPFGFSLLPAVATYGNVTFSTSSGSPATQAILIPAGTAVRVPGTTLQYLTQSDVTIASGQTSVSVRVVAAQTGTQGNAQANTITEMVNPISGVSVTNASAFVSGRNVETDQERFARFQRYILSIARSNLAGIEYGASTATVSDSAGDVTEYVEKTRVVEPYLSDTTQPIGYLDVYVWNGVDSASAALVAAAQKILDGYTETAGTRVPGYTAAGIVATAKASVEQYQDVTVALSAAGNYDQATLIADAKTAIGDYFTSLDVSDGTTEFVFEELAAQLMALQYVTDVSFTTPTGNITLAVGVKLLPGTLTVTVA